ncbi:GNAT family N-acetyltransferase [bacterium]|nr:GNAT family N-acetyltransferase [bacterium]
MAELVLPSLKYKKSFLEAVMEPGAQELFDRFKKILDEENFDKFIEEIKDYSKGVNLKAGFVPESTFWLVEADEYIGRLSIRHELNENLLKTGGHIGYDIRPSKRGMGYGKEILHLGLEKAKELGLKKILVTCSVWNPASKKIIEANGGIFENEVVGGSGKSNVLRYWIDIK